MKKMLRMLLVSFFALGLSTLAFAQEQEAVWYLDKPIADVEFTGLKKVLAKDLKGLVSPFIGKPLSKAVLSDLERRLLDTEFFDAVSAAPKEGPDGKASVIIVYKVTERPVISSIVFDGNAVVRDSHLQEILKINAGDVVSRVKAREAQAAIKEHYTEKGFSKATVDFEFVEVPGRTNVRELRFSISEGYRTTIKAIRFSGNTVVSAGTLKGVLASKEQSLLDPGQYTEANFELDKENLLKWYRDNGYVAVKISDILRDQTLQEKDKREYLTITFVIEEGKKYTFGGYVLSGNTTYSTEELLSKTKSKLGAPVNMSKVQTDYQLITSAYYDTGYAFNSWALEEKRDEEKASITWELKVEERGLAYIGAIQIRGNEKTKLPIIERELPFKVGDVFSTKALREAYLALMNTRYFSSVLPEPSVMGDGKILITISVVEQNTIDMKVGGSLSGDEDFPIAFIGNFSDANFLGDGRSFSAKLSLSGSEQSVSSQIYDAWFLGDELGGGVTFDLSRSKKSTIDLLADTTNPGGPDSAFETTYLDYENWNLGLDLTLTKTWRLNNGRFNVNGGFGTELNYLNYDESFGIPKDAKIVANKGVPVIINNIAFGTSFDGRDIYYDPSKGLYASGKATLYGGLLFGARDYIQADLTLQAWIPLWNIPVGDGAIKTSLGINSSMSLLLPQFWTASGVPYSAGERSLYIQPMAVARGWNNWAEVLSDVQTGGRALWNNWAEIRTPVIPQLLSFDGFFDAVRLKADTNDIFDLDAKSWLFGFGAGFRLAMQGLPLRFYLGKRFAIDDAGTVQWQAGSLFSSGANSTDGIDFILAVSLF